MPKLWQRFRAAFHRAMRSPAGRRALTVETLEDRRLLAGGLPNVTYHGGPLLENVQIEALFEGQAWTANPSLQSLVSQVDGFLSYFPTSPYLNVLKQYNVGNGSFLKDVVVGQDPPNGQTIDDSQIRQILDAQIAAHQLDGPTANSLYVFFTPPGVVVTDGGQNSTNNFAGYHDTFRDSAGATVYYAVVPYPTGGVVNVRLSDFQQMTVILSHEISEAMTDPDTQTGWFDPRNGEIGDIAEGHIGVLGGYVVQGTWSQAQQQIVVPTDTTGTALVVNAVPVEATAGQALTSLVATITGTAAGTTASSFKATIDWGDGITSTGTITADPNGGFDVSGTNTYSQAGSFAVTVTVRNQAGSVVGTALGSANVASAPVAANLTARGTVVTGTAGQAISSVVATFTDSAANVTVGSFSAMIDWGDGTTSAGTVSVDPRGGFDVSGTHTYPAGTQSHSGLPFDGPNFAGSVEDLLGDRYFVVGVTIHDATTNSAATALSLAKVVAAPPRLDAQGQNVSATTGQSFSGVVATFTESNAQATAGEFSATINWGDGTTSTGTVAANAAGGFVVRGSHTYTDSNDWFGFPDGWGIHFNPGNRRFLVEVTIHDTLTQDQAKVDSLATVAPAAANLVVTAQNLTATSGQAFSGIVATFTDATAGATTGSFTATINWGDGTTSTGVISADPNGGFDVSGSHTYTLGGGSSRLWSGPGAQIDPDDDVFPFAVTVRSTTNSDAGSAQAVARVSPASANVQSSGTVVTTVFNQPFSGTVATFTPLNPSAPATSFTATIDWGDGTDSVGTIVADPNGGFDVMGTHTYRSLGGDGGWNGNGSLQGKGTNGGATPFYVSVLIQNMANNGIAQAVSLASVSPMPPRIAANGANLSLTTGTAFSGTVATFTDTDSAGIANLRANIAWGDGTVSAGTVTANSTGGFTVRGSHTYAYGGTYRISVKIRDADGNTTLALGTATVAGTATPATLTSVALAFLQSTEYLSNQVIQDYQQLLGRTPTAAEVSGWVGALQQGVSDAQVMAGFLSSAEYFAHAGNTPKAWVDALYHTVLGRSADAAGEATWIQDLATGVSRATIALDFVNSQERDALVVANYYQQYLGRSASSAEIAGWVNVLQQGVRTPQVIANFLGSQEYFQTHNANPSDWLTGVYQNVLARQPDQTGYDGWIGVLNSQRS